jgi:hypothetical protein
VTGEWQPSPWLAPGCRRCAAPIRSRRTTPLLRAQLYAASVSHSTEIYKILIEKPKLRKYVYDGRDIDETHPDYDEFASLADTILDRFDITLISMEIKDSHGRIAWPGPAGWRKWMVDLISTSPGLRRYFAAWKEFYADNPRLLALFEEGEQKARQKAEASKGAPPDTGP